MRPGTQLSHYVIDSPLGAGAMGEVWRAKDTRLGREVAIKVLPEQFTADAERLRRFEREAKTLASLNHPHIAQIFGVDQVGDTCFLVLELVEGESLDERLKRGALPVDEALDVGRQIAEGLEAAHEAGVIHRDLKPANIRLTPDGRVKLLDFGLAKPAVQGRDAPTSTDSVLATEHGRLLGTPTYMAPEQARAKPIDRRVDIWAFGCVLYECLTARRAFEGESMTDVLGAVLHTTPDLARLPPGTPPGVRELLARCLEKDPRRRLRDIGEARLALETAATAGAAGAMGATMTASGAAAASDVKRRRPWLVAAWVASIAAATATAFAVARGPAGEPVPAPDAPIVRSSLTLPADVQFFGGDGSLALSPDGQTLVLTASRGGGKQQLWLRPLDSLEPQPLVGTEGASYPFWSPDGRTIAFFGGGKLKRIPATGGSVTTLCDAADARGGSWGPDNTLVFAPQPFGPLLRVPAAGGTPVPITQAEGRVSHRLPHHLPLGRHLIYSSQNSGTEGIFLLDLTTGESTRLADDQSEGLFVGPAWMAFVRSRALMIQPFDVAAGRLTGEPRRLVERVEFLPPRFTGAYTISAAGTMVYRTDPAPQRLEWFDMDGRSLGRLGDPAQYAGLRLSPDGTRVGALVARDDGMLELWVFDAQRGLGSRLVEGLDTIDFLWSPDGRQIAYGRDMSTNTETWVHDIGTGEERRLSSAGWPAGWSRDGRWLAINAQEPGSGLNVYSLPADGSGEPRAVLATPAAEMCVAVSPDGRWLLVSSDQSGREELCVAPVVGNAPLRALTSTGVGQRAWWLDDGRVVYLSASGKQLFELTVKPREGGDELEIGEARPAFSGRELPSDTISLSPDGKRLLAIVPGEQGAGDQLTLVQNWPAAIEGQ